MEEQHQEKASTRSSVSSGSPGGKAKMKCSEVQSHILGHLRGILSLQSKPQRPGSGEGRDRSWREHSEEEMGIRGERECSSGVIGQGSVTNLAIFLPSGPQVWLLFLAILKWI